MDEPKFEELHSLLLEKIARLRKAWIIETHPARKFQWKTLLEEAERDLETLEQRSRKPFQRPSCVPHFTNRVAELAQLLATLQPGQIVTLCGPGGIGKTALTAEAIWQLPADRFPDGLIFHTFYGQPDPNVALEHIARSFEVEPKPTPASAALQALTGKRALLILDGAEDAQNLRAVLNVRGACGVLITSRSNDDAEEEWQEIAPLEPEQAVELLRGWGGAFAADDAALRDICALVGCLPLAIRLVGRYLSHKKQPAAKFLRWLRESPLTALDQGKRREQSVPLLMERSVAQVSPDAQRVLSVTGVLAMTPFHAAVVAAALELPEMETELRLGELVSYGMLTHDGERYAVSHALIHTYSRKRLTPDTDTVARLAAHYAAFANEQSKQGTRGFALLNVERPHILRMLEACAEHEQWQAITDVVYAIDNYLDLQGYWTERQTSLETGLSSAQKQGDRKGEGWCNNQIGLNCLHRGDYATALTYLEQSLAINREIGNKYMEGATLNNLSQIYDARGDYATALTYLEQSLAIRREIGDKAGEGVTLNNLSRIYDARGDYTTALTYLDQSLAICREIGDKAREGVTLNNLATTAYARGDYAAALTYLEQSLAITRDIGDKAGEGTTLNNLGAIYKAKEDNAAALRYYEQSLAISREIGDKYGEGGTLWNLGEIFLLSGQKEQAKQYLQASLAIFEQIQSPKANVVRKWLAALEGVSEP